LKVNSLQLANCTFEPTNTRHRSNRELNSSQSGPSPLAPSRGLTLHLTSHAYTSHHVSRSPLECVFSPPECLKGPTRPHLRPIDKPNPPPNPRSPIRWVSLVSNAWRTHSSAIRRSFLLRSRACDTRKYLHPTSMARTEILE
jgi:hypothetical protein